MYSLTGLFRYSNNNLFFQQLYMGQSLAEFSMKWSHWQQECKHRLDNETYAGHPPLHTICKV